MKKDQVRDYLRTDTHTRASVGPGEAHLECAMRVDSSHCKTTVDHVWRTGFGRLEVRKVWLNWCKVSGGLP